MRHHPAARPVAAFGLALALWGCGDSLAPRFELERARDRWAAMRPQTYSLVVARWCFCLPEMAGPVVVEVNGDGSVSRRYVDTQAVVAESYAGNFPTVEGLFALIEDALARDAHRLEVEYNATFGHPIRIDIDYDEHAVDDEVSYLISDFTVR